MVAADSMSTNAISGLASGTSATTEGSDSVTKRTKAGTAEVDAHYDVEMELLADAAKAFSRDRYRRRMVFGKLTTEYRSHTNEQRVRVLRYLRDRFVGKDVAL